VSTLAGGAPVAGWTDGSGTNVFFNGCFGITTDSVGNIYVSDNGGGLVRHINTTGVVSTLAGSYLNTGLVDGTGTTAKFQSMMGLAMDTQLNVYVADFGNYAVRKVTTAGTASTLYQQSGLGFQGLAFSSTMGLYTAEYYTHVVSIIATSGSAMRTVVAGTGSAGYADGMGTLAAFNSPFSLVFSASRDLFVGEYSNRCIRRITSSGACQSLTYLLRRIECHSCCIKQVWSPRLLVALLLVASGMELLRRLDLGMLSASRLTPTVLYMQVTTYTM
jgi:hypothetical protein